MQQPIGAAMQEEPELVGFPAVAGAEALRPNEAAAALDVLARFGWTLLYCGHVPQNHPGERGRS